MRQRPTARGKTAAAGSASGAKANRREEAKWWARRLFRLFGLLAAGIYAYNKFFVVRPALTSLNGGEAGSVRIQFDSKPIELDSKRRNAVLAAFKNSYSAYERDAFGKDNYHPISQHGDDMTSQGPIGYFIVDSLDSLLLLGLTEEYKRARDWVDTELHFDLDDKFHTFEITIRVLGGLLSAYHLSGEDAMYLRKAVELADRLLPVFDTPSGIPHSFVNLHKRVGIPDMDNRGQSSVAEAGTLQLEFKYLSELTGNPIYWQKVEKVMHVIQNQEKLDGLVPIFMSTESGRFTYSEIRLGSRGDSYYEYLIKQYLQTNSTEEMYRTMYDGAMTGVKKHLLKLSIGSDPLMYTSELIPQRDEAGKVGMVDVPKQDHLVCFLGGSFMLGATADQSVSPPDPSTFTASQSDDFYIGQALIKTCVSLYTSTKTGLAPEIAMFFMKGEEAMMKNDRAGRDWWIKRQGRAIGVDPPIDARNILRPETVESLFLAYRITGDPIYREWGWQIFQAFERHCKIPTGGYASIKDVDQVPVEFDDNMETFWIAETLKYLYLLFSEESLIPLDKYVFNTEAHILPIFTPTVIR